MPDYREMYLKLYRAYSKVLAILSQVTLETEEIAMEAKAQVALPSAGRNGEEDYSRVAFQSGKRNPKKK